VRNVCGEVLKTKSYRTPGTPRFKVIRPDQDSKLIDPEMQSRYFSGVVILPYLSKYSKPDNFIVVRDLCKYMDGTAIGYHLVEGD
jgi:hypothetical protein